MLLCLCSQPYASLRNLHSNPHHDARKTKVLSALSNIAAAHGVSEHSAALRFMLQAGTAPIPRSSKEVHMKENLGVFKYELLAEEMDALWGSDEL